MCNDWTIIRLYSLANVSLFGRVTNYASGYGAQGYVQLYRKELKRFEFICDESWDINDANVVCRMLGFPGALDATVRSQYGNPHFQNAAVSNVKCTGAEDSIFDCPADTNPSCDRSRSAGVHCLGT